MPKHLVVIECDVDPKDMGKAFQGIGVKVLGGVDLPLTESLNPALPRPIPHLASHGVCWFHIEKVCQSVKRNELTRCKAKIERLTQALDESRHECHRHQVLEDTAYSEIAKAAPVTCRYSPVLGNCISCPVAHDCPIGAACQLLKDASENGLPSTLPEK